MLSFLSFSLVDQYWFYSFDFLVNGMTIKNNAVMQKSLSHLNAIVYSCDIKLQSDCHRKSSVYVSNCSFCFAVFPNGTTHPITVLYNQVMYFTP